VERTILASPIGPLDLTVVDGAVARLAFVDDPAGAARPTGSAGEAGVVGERPREPGTAAVVAALEAYFAGRIDALDEIPVASVGTPFQHAVWAALRRIQPGTTVSYAQLATAVERPRAVRAVGQANGRNPVAVIVPCHRVVRHDGTIGGYAGGLDRKRWLLDHERRHGGSACPC
jgi:methylated-DNA-[protein]-cysteine S-methyltransferase